MIYSLSIAEAAENDIREAFMWYEEQKEGLGKRFEEHITKAMESIRSNPVKTQIRYNNTRIFSDLLPTTIPPLTAVVIFGITMVEKGVSKVVPVDLRELV